MANEKATGPSGITSNALKSMVWTEENPEVETDNDDADHLVTVIHTIILEFWGGSFYFNLWESGTLAPVPKKGSWFGTPVKQPDFKRMPGCNFLLWTTLQLCQENNLSTH
eukprot:9837553-Ditylum_brightwellii.AAC.2